MHKEFGGSAKFAYLSIMFLAVSMAMATGLQGCNQLPVADAKPQVGSYPGDLSWNATAGREEWTVFVHGLMKNELLPVFDRAGDIEKFCPKYKQLSDDKRALVASEIVSAVAKFESGWRPTTRMKEPSSGFPKPDPVTGLPVYSEGLLQLSYQDSRNYAKRGTYCDGIRWDKDKSLSPTDPKKTILQPLINLNCGVNILAHLVKRDGVIAQGSGSASKGGADYWSVLREGSSHHLNEIRLMVRRISGCG